QQFELGPGREAAGDRLVVRRLVVDRARRRETVRAGGDRLPGVVHHGLEVVLGRFIGEGALPHHVGAERAVAHVARVVDALGQRLQHIEELREGFPAPLDAGQHGRAADILRALEIAEHQIGFALAARRQGEAAIAHHHAGHALVAGRGADRIPEDLRIHVGMAVDEAGRDDVAFGVERLLRRGAVQAADLGDPAVLDADIGAKARQSGTVDQRAVLDDQVECHESLRGYSSNRMARVRSPSPGLNRWPVHGRGPRIARQSKKAEGTWNSASSSRPIRTPRKSPTRTVPCTRARPTRSSRPSGWATTRRGSPNTILPPATASCRTASPTWRIWRPRPAGSISAPPSSRSRSTTRSAWSRTPRSSTSSPTAACGSASARVTGPTSSSASAVTSTAGAIRSRRRSDRKSV